jgi:hypothetical protein
MLGNRQDLLAAARTVVATGEQISGIFKGTVSQDGDWDEPM